MDRFMRILGWLHDKLQIRTAPQTLAMYDNALFDGTAAKAAIYCNMITNAMFLLASEPGSMSLSLPEQLRRPLLLS